MARLLLLAPFVLAGLLTGFRTERLSSAALLVGAVVVIASILLRAVKHARPARMLLALGLLVGLGRVEPIALYAVLQFLLRNQARRPGRRRDRAWMTLATLSAALLVAAAVVAWPRSGPRPPHVAAPWETPSPFVIAHRGAHLKHPENSVASIREAARLGARMAEIDIVDTLDGALVVLHDRRVDRTTNGTGEVRKLTLAALRSLRLKLEDGTLTDEKIPTLEEVLEAARGRIVLYLDSRDAPAPALAKALHDCNPDSVLVYHTRWRWLTEFHALAPTIPLAPESPFKRTIGVAADELDAFAFATSLKRFDATDAAAAHAVGGRILVDVLDAGSDEAPVLEAIARGADGIQTNDPERMVALLGRAHAK